MTRLLSIFDVLLAASLLGLAWTAMASRDLFKAVVLFIVFGLLMSLAWVRLQAPDVALAEAAIGAALTGVLLMNTIRSVNRKDWNSNGQHHRTEERSDDGHVR